MRGDSGELYAQMQVRDKDSAEMKGDTSQPCPPYLNEQKGGEPETRFGERGKL